MDFFGIGAMELVLILVLALIVMGPRQLPQAARKLAVFLRDLRRMWTELSTDFARELNVEEAMGEDLRTIGDAVSGLRRRPSPASLIGGLVGSDNPLPAGKPPSPAEVLFGEEGAAASAKPPAKAGLSQATRPQATAYKPPQKVAPRPQVAAPAAPEATPGPEEAQAAAVPTEAVEPVPVEEVPEADAGSDG